MPRGPSPAEPSPLRASVGEPALLDPERGRIPLTAPQTPRAEAEPTPEPAPPSPRAAPPPLTLAELEARLAQGTQAAAEQEEADEAPPAKAQPARAGPPPATDEEVERAYFGVALSEEAVIFDRARACLEDLALLGAMRRPLADQAWEGRGVAEGRLLARVDAIAACGEEVLPRLVELLGEQPVPDPGLTWALVFLFGSLAGDGALEQAMLLARAAPVADADGVLTEVADALALAPHPGIDGALRPWLREGAPELRAAAARALGRRGTLSTAEALQSARDADPRVAAAGAAALSASTGPLEPAALRDLAHQRDEAVARGALEAAFVRRSEVGPRRAQGLVEEGRPDFAGAAVLMALASGSEGLEPLQQAAGLGSPGVLEALGWYGHPATVEYLLGRLESGAGAPAAAALQRITGASLTEDEPAPEYRPEELPFTRSDGPIPRVELLSTEPRWWRGWWERHGMRARPGIRYRFGHPWSPLDDLHELEDRSSVCHDRQLAHLELCARAGASLPLDPQAFVARQRRQLAAWSELLVSRRGTTGSWPVRLTS